MQTQPEASHFVNGTYAEDADGAPIECVYAATGETVAQVHEATEAVAEAALAAAKAAGPAWAAMTGTERGRILRRAADIFLHQRSREAMQGARWRGCSKNGTWPHTRG